MGQRSPDTAIAVAVEDGINHGPHLGLAWPPTGAGRRQEGLQDSPLLACQITGVWLRVHTLSTFETPLLEQTLTGRRASSRARRPEDLHRHDRRQGCCPGAEPAEAAGSDKLKVAYQVFKDEACDVSPKYAPKTVSTDGWKGTQAAWKLLFTKVVILLCFLHGWLKIRDRAKHLKEVFAEVSRRVWDTYHPPDRRSFDNDCSLRQWAADTSQGSSWRRSWTSVASATAGRLPTATPAATARATCLTD